MTLRIRKGLLAASLVYIVAVAAGGNYAVQTLCVTMILSGLFVAFMNWREDRKSRTGF